MTTVNHPIYIPEDFLLIVAVHGNMGDGELRDLMRTWAQNECRKLHLLEKLKELQNQRLLELTMRLRNVLGDEVMDNLAARIAKAAKALKESGAME